MLTPTKAVLAFSDGVEHELSVESGQSVLDAALAAEAPVLFQCGTGSCGSCLAHLDEGEALAGGVDSWLSVLIFNSIFLGGSLLGQLP